MNKAFKSFIDQVKGEIEDDRKEVQAGGLNYFECVYEVVRFQLFSKLRKLFFSFRKVEIREGKQPKQTQPLNTEQLSNQRWSNF